MREGPCVASARLVLSRSERSAAKLSLRLESAAVGDAACDVVDEVGRWVFGNGAGLGCVTEQLGVGRV